eukprot:262088-Prorocentrum_minimum.AAC.1
MAAAISSMSRGGSARPEGFSAPVIMRKSANHALAATPPPGARPLGGTKPPPLPASSGPRSDGM